MASVLPFSDEQLRTLINLRTRYEAWMDVERRLMHMPYDLRRKRIAGKDYLYEIFDRSGNGKSLGRWNDDLERIFLDYKSEKERAKKERADLKSLIDESGRLYRANRLPLLSSDAGSLLRELDKQDLLGRYVLVVGTNAMPAYSLEAAGQIVDAPDETEDFDLAWTSDQPSEVRLWDVLKAIDPTFTVNTERSFQARNSKAYEVEILIAPSRTSGMQPNDQPRPVPLPEQEWLLLGTPVDQIVGCRDGSPARIVAPDPRWFALHKLWMSEKPTRSPLKRPKDRRQGLALFNAISESMPQYPIDKQFEDALPEELISHYQKWKESRDA